MTEVQEDKMSSFDDSENLRLDKSLTPTTLALSKMVLKASQRENILPSENGASTKSPIRNSNPKLKIPPKTQSDEDAEWSDRTEVLTRVDHEEHVVLAGEVLSGLLNSLPAQSPDGGDTVSERSYVSVTSEIDTSSSYQTAVDYQELDSKLDISDLTEIATPFARNSSPNCFTESCLDELNSSATPIALIPSPSCCHQTTEGSYSELDSIVGHLERLNLNATCRCSTHEALRSEDKGKENDSELGSVLSANHAVDKSFDFANSSYDIIELPCTAELLETQLEVTEPTVKEFAFPTEVDGYAISVCVDVNGFKVPALLQPYESPDFSLTNEYEAPDHTAADEYESPGFSLTNEYEAPDLSATDEYTLHASLKTDGYEVLANLEATYFVASASVLDAKQYEVPANFEVNEHKVAASLEAEYKVPTLEINEYVVASLLKEDYEVPAPESNTYEVPASESNTYEVPASESNTYEVPASESNTYEVPASESNTYEVPASESNTYEVPASESNTYEVPASEYNTYEVPASEYNTYEVPASESNTYEVPASESNKYEVSAPPETNDYEVPASPETNDYEVPASPETNDYEVPASPETNDYEVPAPPESNGREFPASPETNNYEIPTPEVNDCEVPAPPEINYYKVPAPPETNYYEVLAPEINDYEVPAPPGTKGCKVPSPEANEYEFPASPETSDYEVPAPPEVNEYEVLASDANKYEIPDPLETKKDLDSYIIDVHGYTIPSLCELSKTVVPESLESIEISKHIADEIVKNTGLATLEPGETFQTTQEELEPALTESLVSEEVCEKKSTDQTVTEPDDPAIPAAHELVTPTQEAFKPTSNKCGAQGDIEIGSHTATASSLEESAVELGELKPSTQETSSPAFQEHSEFTVKVTSIASEDVHTSASPSPEANKPTPTSQESSSIASLAYQKKYTEYPVEATLDTSTATAFPSLFNKSIVETNVKTCEPIIPASQKASEPATPSEEVSKTTPTTLRELCEFSVTATPASQQLNVTTASTSEKAEFVAQTALKSIATAAPAALKSPELESQELLNTNEPTAQALLTDAPDYIEHNEHLIQAALEVNELPISEPLVDKSAAQIPVEFYESTVLESSNTTVPITKAVDETTVQGLLKPSEFFVQTNAETGLAAVVISQEPNEQSVSTAYEYSESANPTTLDSNTFFAQTQATNELAASSSFTASEPSVSVALEANEIEAVEGPCDEQGKSTHSFDFLDKLFEEAGAFEDDISRIIGLLGADNPTIPMPSADSQTMADAQNNTVMEPSQRPDLDNNEVTLNSRPMPEIAAKSPLVDNANGLSPETALSLQDNGMRSGSNHHVQGEQVFKLPHPLPVGPSPVSDAMESTDLPIQPCLLDSTMSLDSGIDDLNNTKQRNGACTGEGVAVDSKGITQTTVNFSEAGPDVADCRQEEFKSATDFFMDPKGLDFLEKHHGKQDVDSALARMSLYVKFDPCLPERARVVNQWLSTCGQPENVNEKEVSSPHRTPGVGVPLADNLKLIDLSTSPTEVQREERPLQSSPATGVVTATPESSVLPDQEVRRMLAVQELLFQERLLMKDVEYDKKVKQLEKENAQLRSQVQEVRQSQSEMTQVVCEYEKTLTQLIADSDRQKQLAAHSEQQLTKDRDQALEDMQNVELAFGDLHRRYEKLKMAVEGFKKNEDTLTKCLADFQETIKSQNERYELLKFRAEERLESASLEIENARKNSESEIAALRAQLKMAEMRIDGLEKALEQKGKENSELTNICDELIAQVGKTA